MNQPTLSILQSIPENIDDYSVAEAESSAEGLSPVCRLNNKILQSIFYLASADRIFCQKDSVESRASTTRYTAQVCKRWRLLTIHFPDMWLGPVLSMAWSSSHKWSRIVLQRSCSHPLGDVEIPPGLSETKFSNIVTLISKVKRIKSLTISIPPAFSEESKDVDPNDPELLTNGRNPLDLMENLTVGRSIRRHSASPRYDPIPKRFGNMREIKLGQNSFFPMIDLLKALLNLKNLEVLNIQRPYDDPPTEISHKVPEFPSIEPVAELNSLTRLTISAPISTCACILKNIGFAPSCAVQLDCHLADVGPYLKIVLWYIERAMLSWGCDPIQGGCQYLRLDSLHFEYMIEGPENYDPDDADDELKKKFQPNISLALYWSRSRSLEEHTKKVITLLSLGLTVFQSCHDLPVIIDIDIDDDLKVTHELQGLIIHWLKVISRNHTLAAVQDLRFRTWKSVCLIVEAVRDKKILPYLNGLTFYNMKFEGTDFRVLRSWQLLLSYLGKRTEEENCDCVIDFVLCNFSDFEHILRIVSVAVASLTIDGKDYDATRNDEDMDEDSDGYDSDDTIHGL